MPHYFGEVPAAAAHDGWEWEDGIFGQAAVRIRMLLGTHKPFMESTHSGELRQTDWADAMEATVRQRFSRAVLDAAGLEGMSLESADCRTSTCRLDVAYPKELADRFPSHESRSEVDFNRRTGVIGSDGPIERLILRSGPLATTTGLVPGRKSTNTGSLTRGIVLIFSEKEINPNDYMPWVRSVLEEGTSGERADRPSQTDGASPRR